MEPAADAGVSGLEAPREESWPAAIEGGAEPAPATRITLRPQRIDVDNGGLVDTWPPADRERAMAAVEPEHPQWPRIHATLSHPAIDDRGFPELLGVLGAARRAERASTGAGTGAGRFGLRVASDVPFEDVERVLHTAALAGYHEPQLLLGLDGSRLSGFPWPRAASAGAPSEAEIREAMASIERGAEPTLPIPRATGARVVLAPSAPVRSTVEGEPRQCDSAPSCATVLRGVTPITLQVARDFPFGELAPWLARLPAEGVRVVSH